MPGDVKVRCLPRSTNQLARYEAFNAELKAARDGHWEGGPSVCAHRGRRKKREKEKGPK